ISGGANARLTGEDVARRIRRLTPRIVMCQLEVPMEATEAALSEARIAGSITILDPAPGQAVGFGHFEPCRLPDSKSSGSGNIDWRRGTNRNGRGCKGRSPETVVLQKRWEYRNPAR